ADGTPFGSLLANGDVLVARVAFFTPATLLGVGNVLLTGFRQECKGCGFKPSNAAVLYEVGTNTYAFTGGMNSARVFDSAVPPQWSGVVLWSNEYDFEWRNTGYHRTLHAVEYLQQVF